MRIPRPHLATALAAALVLVAPSAALAGSMFIGANCSGSGVQVDFSYYEDPNYPTGTPEFVGYDVRRFDVLGCGVPVVVNAVSFARTGGNDQYSLTDTPPPNGVWSYDVIMVDAAHHQVYPQSYCDPCHAWTYVSCPLASVPISIGTVDDWGWTVFIQACPGSCYPSAYIGGQVPPELRAYAGTGTVLRFYGQMGCGTVEGCALGLDHYEVATCQVVVPTRRTSWGALKSHYR